MRPKLLPFGVLLVSVVSPSNIDAEPHRFLNIGSGVCVPQIIAMYSLRCRAAASETELRSWEDNTFDAAEAECREWAGGENPGEPRRKWREERRASA